MVPYKGTGLTSAVEQSQSDSTERLIGVYYQDYDGTIQKLLASVSQDPTDKYWPPVPTVALKRGTPLAANTPPEIYTSVCPSHPSSESWLNSTDGLSTTLGSYKITDICRDHRILNY